MHRIGEFFELYAFRMNTALLAGWKRFWSVLENIQLNATHIVCSMNEFWSSLFVSLCLSVSLAQFCSFCRSICHVVVHYILVESCRQHFRCIRCGINENVRREQQNHWIGMRWRCTVKSIQPAIILSHNHLALACRICVCVLEYEKKNHTHINYRKWKMCAPKRSTTPEILYKIDEFVGKRIEWRSLSHTIGMPVYYTRCEALNACVVHEMNSFVYVMIDVHISYCKFLSFIFTRIEDILEKLSAQYSYTFLFV